MHAFDSQEYSDPFVYGPAFADLISVEHLMPLDSGHPNESARNALSNLSSIAAISLPKVGDYEMTQCCLAGVWLLYDFLAESHTISQRITTASGSFWHGIMHRREGDFSNAKYWFDRAGDHPVFSGLMSADGSSWDSHRFVDDCQRALRTGDATQIAALREVQRREWQTLFDFCYRAATGEREA